jgi:hypothetical protein
VSRYYVGLREVSKTICVLRVYKKTVPSLGIGFLLTGKERTDVLSPIWLEPVMIQHPRSLEDSHVRELKGLTSETWEPQAFWSMTIHSGGPNFLTM